MGMTVVAFPNEQNQVRALQQELFNRNKQLAETEERLKQAEQERNDALKKVRTLEAGVAVLRQVLTPLHNALGMIFGELDSVGVFEPIPTPSAPKASVAWDSWKAKLGGAAAKIIDFLLIHGELNQTQMRIHLGTNRMQTVYDATSKLNKAGLIVKNGDKFSLKEL